MKNIQLINVPIKYSTNISILANSKHKLNPEFSLCDVDVMYVDENRNGTDISREVVEDAIYSLYGVPIVGEWIEDENRFGDHGEKIEITRDKITYKVTTKPIGFVTREAVDNAEWIEKPLPNGHEIKTWLRLKKCVLWTGRYEEAQSIIENGTSQSMEVKFLDGQYEDNGFFKPSKMIFSALCAIGVEPCFEEANIRRSEYNLDSFKQEFSYMLDEYKKSQQTTKQQNKEGVQQMELKKFVEALSQVKIGETDSAKYRLLSISEEKVFALDLEDYKAYGFNYAVASEEDNEELIIDFDSKCEMSLSACDKITEDGFEEFSIADTMTGKVESEVSKRMESYTQKLTDEFNAKYDEMKDSFEELDKSYKAALEELSVFRAADSARKEKEHKDAIDTVVNDFAKKLGRVPEFLIYKARLDYSKTVDEVQKELTLMAGKSVMDNQTKANFAYTPVSTTLSKNNKKTNTDSSRYGHLLDKFM